MVARNPEHDHSDGEPCPGCRFREALAEHLALVAGEGGEPWVWTVGEITELMGTASAALARLRNAQYDDTIGDDDDSATEAAAAISRLGGAIDELWHMLVDDDDQVHE
jgi:hypothetical protein